MAHQVTFKISSKAELGPSDVVFRAYDDDGLVGTLMVSRGGVEWRSANRAYVVFADWGRFDELAGSFPTQRKKPTPRTRKKQRAQARAATRRPRTRT